MMNTKVAITQDEFETICSAKEAFCEFCGKEQCSGCDVERIYNEAYESAEKAGLINNKFTDFEAIADEALALQSFAVWDCTGYFTLYDQYGGARYEISIHKEKTDSEYFAVQITPADDDAEWESEWEYTNDLSKESLIALLKRLVT